VVLLCLGVMALGAAVPERPWLVLCVGAAILVLGITALEPGVLPLVATVGVVVVYRVTLPLAGDLTVSDVLLFAAVWPALVFARRGYSAPMRNLLWLAAAYQLATVFTLIANPYLANTIDWFHNWLLVAGALVVGWAVGRQGYARLGLSLLLLLGAVLAVSTIAQGLQQYATGDFTEVYTLFPYPMHKNFVGTALAAIALIAYIHPGWMGWARGRALAVFWLCAVAIVMAQSRQAMVALAIVLVFIVLRRDPDRTRSKVILVAVPPVLVLVALTVKAQYQSGNRFSSVNQRLEWVPDAMEVWQSNPLFGAGLRWWYTDRFPSTFQPPNAELEALTTAGVVGLVAFLALMIGSVVILTRVDPRYGTLAVAIVLLRFIEGQLDIFWVAVGPSLPFLVAGVCLGVQARDAEEKPVGELERSRWEVRPG
jgi:polysaccharide biosynthesis protein PslJ